MKRILFSLMALLLVLCALLLVASPMAVSMAQTNPTSTPAANATLSATSTGPSNNVQGFLVICDTRAVLNFTGTLVTGFDVYYQVFSGAVGGTALTSLQQVQGDGTLLVSSTSNYTAGSTVAAGASGSARVIVARDADVSRVDFEFTLTDVQDGCANPQNPAVTAIDAGAAPSTGTTTGTASPSSAVGTNLFAPNGRTLNSTLSLEPTVVVGARTSDTYRSDTPGLIYAACDEFPLALPGIVYDSDNVTVYWSWFTRTLEQMNQHLTTSQYSVRVNGAPFNNVLRSEPELRGGNYYVFYSGDAGNLRPGHYEVEYRVTWTAPFNDGYEDFGPGTANPQDAGNCNFDVLRNPDNASVAYENLFFPTNFPVHNIFPNE